MGGTGTLIVGESYGNISGVSTTAHVGIRERGAC